MTAAGSGELLVRPLTADRWSAFTDLLGQGGPAGRCWCMAPRIGREHRRRPADCNRADFRGVVEQGPPPGLLALREQLAVGWCQVVPRAVLPALDHAWRTRKVDDVPVWVLACIYVRKGHRRRGVSAALIAAAVDRRPGVPARSAPRRSRRGVASSAVTDSVLDYGRAGTRCRQGAADPEFDQLMDSVAAASASNDPARIAGVYGSADLAVPEHLTA
jgi:GNAT superfamily N-acetyltransferase